MNQQEEDDLVLSPSEARAHNTALKVSGAKSTRKALASIVLGFELIIVVLIGLTIFGLGITDPRWIGLAIGGGLALMCVLSLALLRMGETGIILGWITHGLMLATAFILPVALVVGAVFTALWIYCIVKGGKMDRDRAAHFASLGQMS